MITAALVAFALLLVAWLVAPADPRAAAVAGTEPAEPALALPESA